MKIGEVAQRANVSVDTIRFYERRGLLPPPRRQASGYRVYAHGAIERIRLIKNVQGLGLKLDEIATMLATLDAGAAVCTEQRRGLTSVVERIDLEIAQLQARRAAVVRLLQCCSKERCSGIVRNHSFVDGNKRAGLVAAAVFIQLNGMQFHPEEAEEVATILDLASGRVTDEQLALWFSENCTPRS